MQFRPMLLASLTIASPALIATSAMAQTHASVPKGGTRLIPLGTASGPIPRARRTQSSNILIVNGALYVVDAGDGVARRLVKARIDVRDVGTIFITHLHDDHTAGLGTLMSSAWDQNRTRPIHVYGQTATERMDKVEVGYFSARAGI